ncbi:MAG: hypothetical protein H7270_07780 [Dermatophilaceae bacterium]|nr:hypothetical protein [Dermatophilaceae bacterium]
MRAPPKPTMAGGYRVVRGLRREPTTPSVAKAHRHAGVCEVRSSMTGNR